jgi:hypothetical protein
MNPIVQISLDLTDINEALETARPKGQPEKFEGKISPLEF